MEELKETVRSLERVERSIDHLADNVKVADEVSVRQQRTALIARIAIGGVVIAIILVLGLFIRSIATTTDDTNDVVKQIQPQLQQIDRIGAYLDRIEAQQARAGDQSNVIPYLFLILCSTNDVRRTEVCASLPANLLTLTTTTTTTTPPGG